MRKTLIELALASLVAVQCACYHRAHPHVNYYVPGECKPSLSLLDCDYSSPPHCKKVIASYKLGCEQLATK